VPFFKKKLNSTGDKLCLASDRTEIRNK